MDFDFKSFDVLLVYNTCVSGTRAVLAAIKHRANATFRELEGVALQYILFMLTEVTASTRGSSGVAVITMRQREAAFYTFDRGGNGCTTFDTVPASSSFHANEVRINGINAPSIYWNKDKEGLLGYLNWYKENVTM